MRLWVCVIYNLSFYTLYKNTERQRHTSHKEISKTKMGNVYFCRFTWWWIFSSSVAQMYVTLDSFVIKENINHNKINFGLCMCVFLFPSFFLLLNKLNLCMCVFLDVVVFWSCSSCCYLFVESHRWKQKLRNKIKNECLAYFELYRLNAYI